jgi:hypothetical protein
MKYLLNARLAPCRTTDESFPPWPELGDRFQLSAPITQTSATWEPNLISVYSRGRRQNLSFISKKFQFI